MTDVNVCRCSPAHLRVTLPDRSLAVVYGIKQLSSSNNSLRRPEMPIHHDLSESVLCHALVICSPKNCAQR